MSKDLFNAGPNTNVRAVRLPCYVAPNPSFTIGVQPKQVDVTVYLVIEMPQHEAYPVGKETLEKKARELAANGTLPIRWIDSGSED